MARHDAVEDVLGRGPSNTVHDQSIFLSDTRLSVDYALLDWLSASLVLPYRVFHTTIRYLDDTGQAVDLTQPNIHHRNQTLTGFADAWLLGHTSLVRAPWTFDVRLGASLPIGATVPDPFALGDRGLAHEHFQFGTGTFNPIVGAAVNRAFTGFGVGAWGLSQQMLYQNSHGYRAGSRYAWGVSASSPLFTTKWRFELGSDGQYEAAESWSGVQHSDDGNRGRLDLFISTKATWRVAQEWSVNAAAQFPVYTHIVGGQVSYPLIWTLGVSWSRGLLPASHVAEVHAEPAPAAVPGGPPADWTGLDLAEVARKGEAVALDPVPGKVTVFDLWAAWCLPCREVDRKLAALARKYPGRLAVRKLDVVDWDSAAAAKYLAPGGFSLPHVKIFGADGKLALEQSGDPQAIATKVERVLRGEPTAAVPVDGRVAITVALAGFDPDEIELPRGQPIVLVFTRRTTQPCADAVVVRGAGADLERKLIMDRPVEIPVTFEKPGRYSFSCGMDMLRGTILVR